MDIFTLIKRRRSIRKYDGRQIPLQDLERIIEAGTYAPNAGGGQRSMIVGIRNPEMVEKIGRLNVSCMNRSHLSGSFVSSEQPSIIDDPSIRSGFYGAPTLCAIFCQRDFLYSIPDAFCIAENMVLAATELGIDSCIIARGEETFLSAEGVSLLREWDIPQNYCCRAFVILGYCKGNYPEPKPRKPWRVKIIH